jgi:probable rRNA maturation factor
VKRIVAALSEKLSLQLPEISIYFVSKQKIAQLHDEFFDDPTPTDCITFPHGEIFICPAVAVEYAKMHLLNPHKELTLYIVHCLLHLTGQGDTTPAERRTMRRKERAALAFLAREKLEKIVCI